MFPDIHGVDPTKFRTNLSDQKSRDGSRRKCSKCPREVEEGVGDSELGENDGLQTCTSSSVGRLDIEA